MASRARRSAFMTPVVLVLGCGHSSPPIDETTHMSDLDPGYVAPPAPDAAAAAPDASPPPDAAVAAPETTKAAVDWDVDCRNCNPPSPVFYAGIVAVEVQGAGVVVTFDRGTRDELHTGDKGNLVDDDRVRIRGSEFVVKSASERTSRAVINLTVDQIRGKHARFGDD